MQEPWGTLGLSLWHKSSFPAKYDPYSIFFMYPIRCYNDPITLNWSVISRKSLKWEITKCAEKVAIKMVKPQNIKRNNGALKLSDEKNKYNSPSKLICLRMPWIRAS